MNLGTPYDRRRFSFYGLWLGLSLILFWKPCVSLIHFSLGNDNASHVVLIPFISAWLIYLERNQVFRRVSWDYLWSSVLLAASAAIYTCTLRFASFWTTTDILAGYVLALLFFWVSGFCLFFGREALKNGRFSMLFLLLMVPLPDPLLNYSIHFLQAGSADIAELIFDLVGVPALREGFVFHLAHLNIEVAKECSGIRSSLALLILALLVAHLFLRSFWKQSILVVVGLLIMVVKNGIRIATLTILAQYVDPGFLYGRLHHEGGVVFFLLGLLLLLPVLWLLQRSEKLGRTIINPPAT